MADTLCNMPRYIRNTDAFGWQGADGPDGPWRSITPPQSGAPWQTTSSTDPLHQANVEVSGVEALSPAAQAVMIAATNGNTNVVNDPVYRQCIAAALRAAVRNNIYNDDYGNEYINANDILAIVTELENLQ